MCPPVRHPGYGFPSSRKLIIIVKFDYKYNAFINAWSTRDPEEGRLKAESSTKGVLVDVCLTKLYNKIHLQQILRNIVRAQKRSGPQLYLY